MSDVKILGLPPSSYVRTARMICAAKGITHDLEPVDFRSAAYRDLHPFAKMPVLQHGDVTLYETLAIGSYIDETFEGPALQPDTPLGKATMLQWISATNDYIYDSIVGGCVSERFVKPMRGLDPDEDKIAAAVPAIAHQLDVIAAGLDHDYLSGAQVSLADLTLAPVIAYLAATPEGEDLLPARPQVTDWMARMREQPDFAQINALPG